MEDSDLVTPPQEPLTTTGKLAEDVPERVEATKVLPNKL